MINDPWSFPISIVFQRPHFLFIQFDPQSRLSRQFNLAVLRLERLDEVAISQGYLFLGYCVQGAGIQL